MIRGTSSIVNVERGSTDIQNVYRGSNLIWSRQSESILKYLLVSTSTSTGGVVAFLKYDADGTILATQSYTEVGANAAWRPRQIISEIDDNNFYYSAGDTSSGLFRKWISSNLTSTASVAGSNTPAIWAPGASYSTLISTSTLGYGFRSKSDLTSVGTSVILNVTKFIVPVTGFSSSPIDIIITGGSITRRVQSTSGLTYSTVWNQSITNIGGAVINEADNQVLILASSALIRNLTTGSAISTLSNIAPTSRFAYRFSNGDLLYYDGSFKRRTWSNVTSNSTTNVWSFSLTSVVWFDIDDIDNLYVVLSATTNGLRKYNSSGTLVWQRNLPANGYGGGLAHK